MLQVQRRCSLSICWMSEQMNEWTSRELASQPSYSWFSHFWRVLCPSHILEALFFSDQLSCLIFIQGFLFWKLSHILFLSNFLLFWANWPLTIPSCSLELSVTPGTLTPPWAVLVIQLGMHYLSLALGLIIMHISSPEAMLRSSAGDDLGTWASLSLTMFVPASLMAWFIF